MTPSLSKAAPSPSNTEGQAAAPRDTARAHLGSAGIVLLLGVLQAIWHRRALNPDGVAYLDLSDELLAGQWGAVVQGYWSPLYPALLALGRVVFGRGAAHETVIAHAVNLAGFAVALGAWSLVLRQLGRRGAGLAPFGAPLGIMAGYAVFAWAMLWLMSLHFVTPDAWLAGWVFLSAALVLRQDDRDDARHARNALLLGASLGAGYLTKSVLLPVAPMFVAGAVWLAPSQRRRLVLTRSVGMLLVIAGPWIAAISVREGRATFGDNGRFNYGWLVAGDRWLSPDPARESGPGAAVFPRIVEVPAVYAWPGSRGTYAPWRDPSAWHGEMRSSATAERQWHVLTRSLRLLQFWLEPWGVLMVVVVVAGATIAPRQRNAALALAAPALVAVGGYAAVFVEGRYVAPFLALLIVAAASVLHSSIIAPRRMALAAGLGVALWYALDIQIPTVRDLAFGALLYGAVVARGTAAASLAAVCGAAMVALGAGHVLVRTAGEAGQLAAGGVLLDASYTVRTALEGEEFPKGRAIAVIGDGPRCAEWARGLRAPIVAELPASEAARFWASSDSVRTAVAHAMRAAGAREIIASGVLPPRLPPGWHRVDAVGLARYALDEP